MVIMTFTSEVKYDVTTNQIMTVLQIGKAKRIKLKFGHWNSRIKKEQASPCWLSSGGADIEKSSSSTDCSLSALSYKPTQLLNY